MLYYTEKAHKSKIHNDFELSVTDEKSMRNSCVAKYWGLACFYKTKNGDLIFRFYIDIFCRTKKEALERYLLVKTDGLVTLLVCHTIDKYRFEWLDFYDVVESEKGVYKVKKLKKHHAFIANEKILDSNMKEIDVDFEDYSQSDYNYGKKR